MNIFTRYLIVLLVSSFFSYWNVQGAELVHKLGETDEYDISLDDYNDDEDPMEIIRKFSQLSSSLKQSIEKSKTQPQSPSNDPGIVLSECEFDKNVFKRVLISADSALDFFAIHVKKIVLDAAVGSRLLQCQLKLIEKGHPNLPALLQTRLLSLQLKSELVSELIVDSVLDNPEITKVEKKNQLPWVLNSSLWERPAINGWKSLSMLENKNDKTELFKAFDRANEVLNEELSDACIAELFKGCNISSNCVTLFMQQPHSAYSLTHQILFFLVADKQNCYSKENFVSKIDGKDPLKFVERLCEEVFLQANYIEKSGYPMHYRDLLSEQITVCAVAGYQNFLKKKWLETILSWQSDSTLGCFMLSQDVAYDDENKTTGTTTSTNQNQQLNFINATDDQQTSSNQTASPGTDRTSRRRVKRSDEIVKVGDENCSIHFTAVSLGALSMYLRYFVNTCLASY